jgi:hypothetical protein
VAGSLAVGADGNGGHVIAGNEAVRIDASGAAGVALTVMGSGIIGVYDVDWLITQGYGAVRDHLATSPARSPASLFRRAECRRHGAAIAGGWRLCLA